MVLGYCDGTPGNSKTCPFSSVVLPSYLGFLAECEVPIVELVVMVLLPLLAVPPCGFRRLPDDLESVLAPLPGAICEGIDPPVGLVSLMVGGDDRGTSVTRTPFLGFESLPSV